MKLITNRISTGKAKRFEDFVADFRKARNIKIASVKTAEQEEGESSGQLDVEPLHQTGESTTMPKAGPSAKKDDGEKTSSATKTNDEEGPDSGQPKAEGSEKFTNDPEVPSKEEKAGSASGKVKVAEDCSCGEEDCDGSCTCACKSCTATRHEAVKIAIAAVKTAGEKGMCSCGKPNFICKGKCKGGDSDDSDDKKDDDKDDDKEAKTDDKEEKEAKADDKEEKDAKTDDKDKEEKEASSKCDKCDCDPCECKDMSCGASKKTEFVKIANLDEKNKGFLKEYWRQLFGDDYVAAIIADK
jgi:hypothetical protein